LRYIGFIATIEILKLTPLRNKEDYLNNLNLSGRLAGLICILLVLIAPAASAQALFYDPSARIPGLGPSQPISIVNVHQTDWIILLEGRPVSAFRLQFGGGSDLNEAQEEQVRAYNRMLDAEQQHFVEAASRQVVSLKVQRSFRFLLNGLAISLPGDDVARLATLPGVKAVLPDRRVSLELVDSVPLIGANQAWQLLDADDQPVTGRGIRVALIDTGVDYTHPDLGGCFGPGCKVVDGYDLYNNDSDPRDDNGHGTHCAGIVAANGSLKGVAPDVSLYAFKVLSSAGTGSISVIIAGMERAADLDQDPATIDPVDIINMSLGIPGAPDDPWALAVDTAAGQGIVVAVSAGNSGPDYTSLESPGLAQRSLSVGAADKLDQIAPFSSRGPIPGFDGWLKPDILAPGVAITSTYLGGLYASASGTSMAAPHVAGAAALVKQLHPTWTPDQIKSNLLNTALDLGLDVHTQGAGRLRVDRAVLAPGLVLPASISFGTVDISQPLWSDTRLLWLENITETERYYSLSAETRLPDSVNVSIEPANMTLLPGEKRRFSVVLAVETLRTPPDLERNEGWIRVQQEEDILAVPFAFQMPPIFSESRLLPFDLQTSFAVALRDLDGDGDLDAFIGNTAYYDNPENTVWLNDGAGNFSDSGQRLGHAFTWDVALGDLDGDGDIDAFTANSDVDGAQPDEVWLNDGSGYFIDSGQRLGNSLSRAIALADLDADGDLDAFITNGIAERGQAEADSVWLNDGHGVFSDSGQVIGGSPGLDVTLGDLDGDGDLDAFIANGDPQRVRDAPNEVWLNDGHAIFHNSGQNLGSALSQAVALGDLDGDADLDAFVANGGSQILDGQPDEIWLNNGSGIFSKSGQPLGGFSSYGAALADLHQDGALDIFVAGYHGGNRVWLNDGHGIFAFSSPAFGTENAADVALGDVDGDGDVDALAANAISKPNRLWLNRGSGGSAAGSLIAPSGLTATVLSGAMVQLAWTDNATGETSYRVERSPDGETAWTEIGVLPADSTRYEDPSVSCEQGYFYRVRAYRDSDGLYSAYSHLAGVWVTACALPASPSNLTAVALAQDQIDLTWKDRALDESAYLIERSLDGILDWAQIASLPANATHYSDTALACNQQYYYRVKAYRAAGQASSPYSNTAYATTARCPLSAPTGLSATTVSASQIDLKWTDDAVDETAYLVERSLDGQGGWVEIAVLPENSVTHSESGLACGTQYYFRVRAFRDSDGLYSPYSNTAKAMTGACLYRIFSPVY
jgi:subtilisin family serine protease